MSRMHRYVMLASSPEMCTLRMNMRNSVVRTSATKDSLKIIREKYEKILKKERKNDTEKYW